MPYRAIAGEWARFGMGSNGFGGTHCAAGDSGGPGPGSDSCRTANGGFHRYEFYIRIRANASTPNILDKSRMRETRSYGSVRGVSGDRHPYRDPPKEPARQRLYSPAPGSRPQAPADPQPPAPGHREAGTLQ